MLMRYISMFSGIEAATVAFHPLGWDPICFAEIEAFPSAVLKHHYPDIPNVGDMTAHDWSRYRGKCDLVVGGPPCQAFSVAGLRRSLDDDRGNLSLSYMRAIHAIDPLWCITENVPGWLSTKDNAFGCFLAGLVGEDAALQPTGGRWTDAGVVDGPERTAAWRILDAQYFGVPQRRRRVFVVSVRGSGNWAAAAALFPLRESLRGDPPPRREAGKGIARRPAFGISSDCFDRSGEGSHGTAGARSGLGIVEEASPALRAKRPNAVAFGGNNQDGPIEVATAVNAHGGPHGRMDFESETFIAHALRGEGFDASEDGTGRGTPIVAVGVALRGREGGGTAEITGEQAPALRASQGGGDKPHVLAFAPNSTLDQAVNVALPLRASSGGANRQAVAFDARQSDVIQYGDKTGPIDTDGHSIAIAFSAEDHGADAGEAAPTLRAGGHDKSHANAGVMPAVAQGGTVRRLTPVECERLQGLPDNWTLIPWRGKPAPDGPRYRAVGNSFAVPVVRWIGERIEACERALEQARAVA